MKIIKNSNGSSLMIVVVFITLLTIMGAALLSASVAHMRTQKNQDARKAGLYASESGIDKEIPALTSLLRSVHEDTNAEVTVLLNNMIAEQQLRYDLYAYSVMASSEGLPALESTATLPPLYNADGTINQSAAYARAKIEYDEIFERRFKEAIGGRYEGRFITDESYFNTYGYADEPFVGLLCGSAEGLSFVDNDGVLSVVLPVFSFYHPQEENILNAVSHKLISVDIKITAPGYQHVNIEQNVMKFDPNILWTKALTAEGSLIVESGSAVVFGNVYAFGDTTTVSGKNGIVVGRGAALTVNGEAVTGRDVRFNSAGTPGNSSLTVNGNLYAENILVDDGIDSVNLNVNRDRSAFSSYSISGWSSIGQPRSTGDVVLKNNLEIRGTNANITIAGNYTGFSGPLETDAATVGSRESSCIVFDNAEIRGGFGGSGINSSINIGSAGTEIIINGTAYLTLNGAAIATGESVALSGNFNAYRNLLEDKLDYFYNFAAHAFHESPSLANPEEMEYYSPIGLFFPMAYKGEAIFVDERADYLYWVTQAFINTSPSGWTDVIFDGGRINFNGTYYGSGAAFANNDIQPRTRDLELAQIQEPRKYSAETMYYCQTNGFGDVFSGTEAGGMYFVEGYRERISSTQFTYGTSVNSTNTLTENGVDYTERVYVSTSTAPVTISGAGSKNVMGVIIARGDVILQGPLDFRGMIITEGNIIIRGAVTVTNDRGYIAKVMAQYPAIYNAFDTKADGVLPSYSFKTADSGGADDVSSMIITRDDFRYVDDKSLTVSNFFNSISDMIQTSNWTVLRY